MLRPVVLVDGRAAGTWKAQRTRGQTEVIVERFADLPPNAAPRSRPRLAASRVFLVSDSRLALTGHSGSVIDDVIDYVGRILADAD